jgi:hypothetical protein
MASAFFLCVGGLNGLGCGSFLAIGGDACCGSCFCFYGGTERWDFGAVVMVFFGKICPNEKESVIL